MGHARVDGSQRWAVLWVHYQAEELRVHHRTTIASEDARAVVMAVPASGRVPAMQATLLGMRLPGARPFLQRFWGTVCQHDATLYLICFINDRCLVLVLVASARLVRNRALMVNDRRTDKTSGGQP